MTRTPIRREVVQGGRGMYWPGPGSPGTFGGTPGQNAQIIVLLPTGGLLMVYGSTATYIWEPDASGSYVNGRARRIADAPHTAWGGWTIVQNDGKILVCSGEYGTTYVFKKCMRFDPFTETWEVFDYRLMDHKTALMSDNGTILDPNTGSVLVPNGIPTPPIQNDDSPVYVNDPVDGQNYLAQTGGGDLVPIEKNFVPYREVTHSIMPNGWMLSFAAQISPVIETNPGFYNTRTIGGVDRCQISLVKPTNFTEPLRPGVFPRKRYGQARAPGPSRWEWRQFDVGSRVTELNGTSTDATVRSGYKVTHAGGNAYTWQGAPDITFADLGGATDFGRRYWEVNYEVGPQMYMPKIGKVVFAGGDGGIWTATTNGVWEATLASTTVTIDRPFNMGYATPSRCGSAYGAVVLGRLGPEWEGKTAATLTAGNYSLSDGALFSGQNVFQVTGNTWSNANETTDNYLQMYVADTTSAATEPTTLSHIRFTSATWNPTTSTWTIVDPIAGSVRGNRDRVLREGDLVYWGFPKFESWDADGVILPNGDFWFVAGYDGRPSVYTWPNNPTFMRFDGVSRPEPIDTGLGVLDNVSNCFGPVRVTPDGNHLVYRYRSTASDNGGQSQGLAFLELLTTERIPDNAWRPVVQSFPPTVVAGSEVTLTGLRLTGVHEGNAFGDDEGSRTHIPLVRLTAGDGRVYYCPTRNYTYRGIDPTMVSSCNVIIPNRVPPGTYAMNVSCNGIASQSTTSVTVASPAPASTGLMMNPYGWKA